MTRRTDAKSVLWLTFLFGFFFFFSACKDSDDDLDVILEEDSYVGEYKLFSFSSETEGLNQERLVAYFKASDGVVFSRQLNHLRTDDKSRFELFQGLKEGTYQLLYFEYTPADSDSPDDVVVYAMGNIFRVTSEGFVNTSNYDSNLGLFGSGTEDDPYLISCAKSLFLLQRIVNDEDNKRKFLPKSPCFRQDASFDMDFLSYFSDNRNGWIPIGNAIGKPFEGIYDGNGYKITGLWSKRGGSVGVGLFGFIRNSVIQRVTLEDAEVQGLAGAAALAGSVITAGNSRDISVVRNCVVNNSTVSGFENGYGIGGVVGILDSNATLWVDSCEVTGSTSISGDYAVGGVLGAGHVYSFSQLTYCKNAGSQISGNYAGIGGIVGSVDTVLVHGCVNSSMVKGSIIGGKDKGEIGTGGIIGGSGMTIISACENTGQITGQTGVGGVIGSTRIATEPSKIYNSVMIQTCINRGNVSGGESVGGICGESQLVGVSLLNEGEIAGKNSVGGVLGFLPVGSLFCSYNNGIVKGLERWEMSSCGGVVGRSYIGLLALNQNFAKVEANNDFVGGVLGVGGGTLMLHYCSNFGEVGNAYAEGYTGGIAGALGNTTDLKIKDYIHIVVGAVNVGLGMIPVVPAVVDKIKDVISVGKYLTLGSVKIHDMFFTITEQLEVKLNKPNSFKHWCDDLSDQINVDNQYYYQEITDRAKSLIASQPLSGMDSQLKKEVITKSYATNFFDLAARLSSETDDYTPLNTFLDNMNNTLQERAEAVEEQEKEKEIFYGIVGGVCLAVSTLATVVSFCVAGGLPAALLIGGFFTVVGGINTVVSEVTDYETNAVILSQCVNAGNISGKGEYGCGLVGVQRQFTVVNDCVNAGKNLSNAEKQYALSGVGSASLRYCLNCGYDWNDYTDRAGDVEFGCYSSFYFSYYQPETSYEDLAKESTFSYWFNDSQMWMIPDETVGNFPIPYKSRME